VSLPVLLFHIHSYPSIALPPLLTPLTRSPPRPCSQRVIEQSEHKLSKLKEDLVTTKEALNRTALDKDVLDQERLEISKQLAHWLMGFVRRAVIG
jgi:hypothetical protein